MRKYNNSDIIRLQKAFPEFSIRVREKEDMEVILFSERKSKVSSEERKQELRKKIEAIPFKKVRKSSRSPRGIVGMVGGDGALRMKLYRRMKEIQSFPQNIKYFKGLTTEDFWPVYEFSKEKFFIHRKNKVEFTEKAPDYYFTIQQLHDMGFKI